MLSYWLLSCLLLVLGWCLYTSCLRDRLPVLHAKYVLLGTVVLSWAIPLAVPSLPEQTQALEAQYLPDYRAYDQWNVVNLGDEGLRSCYKTAVTSQEQCHCEVEQQAEILAYQSNPYYNALLMSKTPLWWLMCAVMSAFLLQLLFRMSCLIALVRSSQIECRELAGCRIWVLRPSQRWTVAISSFTLLRSYIVLPQGVETQFTEEEFQAILLHELGHLQQRDTWQQLLLQGLRSFWWMHPVFYLLQKELDRLNEYAADDFAVQHVGNAKWYAKLLLKAKEQQLKQAPVVPLQLVLYAVQSMLRQRVTRLVHQPQPRTKVHWGVVLGFVACVFWQTSATALPVLEAQNRALEQYEEQQTQATAEQVEDRCTTCLTHFNS